MRRKPPRPTTAAIALLAWFGFFMCVLRGGGWGVGQWVMVAAGAGAAVGGLIVARRFEPPLLPRWEAMWRHPRAPAMFYLVAGVVLFVFGALMMSRTGGSLLVRAVSMPGAAGMFIGIGIAALGILRLPGGRYCARCKYEMSEAIAEDPTQQQCPECGSLWKSRGGTVEGRLVLRWGWIAAGVIVGGVLFLGPMYAMSRPAVRAAPLRIMPTSSLIEEAAMNWGVSATDAWDVLMTRQLSAAEHERLARRLLDGRRGSGIMQRHAETWMQAEALEGRLPRDVVRRFVDEHPYPRTLDPQLVNQQAGADGPDASGSGAFGPPGPDLAPDGAP